MYEFLSVLMKFHTCAVLTALSVKQKYLLIMVFWQIIIFWQMMTLSSFDKWSFSLWFPSCILLLPFQLDHTVWMLKPYLKKHSLFTPDGLVNCFWNLWLQILPWASLWPLVSFLCRLMPRWCAMWSVGWRTQSPSLQSCSQPWWGSGQTLGSKNASTGPGNINLTTQPSSEYSWPHSFMLRSCIWFC